jgi:hypothetical protein
LNLKSTHWVSQVLGRLAKLRRRVLTTRRVLAILFVGICLAAVTAAIVISFNEETTDWFLNFDSAMNDARVFRVTILSVDELAGRAQANTQLILDKHAFVSSPKVKGPINGKFSLNDLDVRIGPVTTTDLGPNFDAMGTVALALLPEDLVQTEPGSDYRIEPPPAAQEEFVVLGQPRFYPFDRYLIIGVMSCNVFASADKKEFFGVEESHTEVYLRAPNFVMRGASDPELLDWPSPNNFRNSTEASRELQKRALGDSISNRKRVFAVVLQRPFFLRFFAVFLFVIAFGSVAYYAVVSEVNAFALQALGYFVGLWAIRQMLVTGGPRIFTVIDYVVLSLYAVLAAILVAKKLWTERTT